jgi:formylglycine-generating enzyme required for sulfatase activity
MERWILKQMSAQPRPPAHYLNTTALSGHAWRKPPKQIFLLVLLVVFLSVMPECHNHPAAGGTPLPSSPSRPAFTPTLIQEPGAQKSRPKDGMILIIVPAGQFLMGSSPLDGFGPDLSPYENEFPQHEVQVAAFWIDQTEVTNAQYQLCVEDGHCSPPKKPPDRQLSYHFDDPSYARHPVVNVTWYQAVADCTWVEARLPSEQEWDYAAMNFTKGTTGMTISARIPLKRTVSCGVETGTPIEITSGRPSEMAVSPTNPPPASAFAV